MGRKNKNTNVDDPQDEGGATENEQTTTKTEVKEEEKNGAEGKFYFIYFEMTRRAVSLPYLLGKFVIIV